MAKKQSDLTIRGKAHQIPDAEVGIVLADLAIRANLAIVGLRQENERLREGLLYALACFEVAAHSRQPHAKDVIARLREALG